MDNVIVRAMGVFGSWYTDYEKRVCSPLDTSTVKTSYDSIEKYLKANSQVGFPQFAISGCGHSQSYLINGSLVTNVLVHGNGFDFEGDVQTLVALGFDERTVQETLKSLAIENGKIPLDYWKENPKFTKDVGIPERLGKDITRLLTEKPELLIFRA